MEKVVEQTVLACEYMSREKIGALIVFTREQRLDEYFKTGTVIDAQVSEQLLRNIFFKNSPLHDGAVVIRDFRISKARVLFDEISNNPDLALELGSRHKACVGATENENDCIAVVVSEESGQISYAIDGELRQNVSPEELRKVLREELVVSPAEEKTQQKKEKSIKKEKKDKSGLARK